MPELSKPLKQITRQSGMSSEPQRLVANNFKPHYREAPRNRSSNDVRVAHQEIIKENSTNQHLLGEKPQGKLTAQISRPIKSHAPSQALPSAQVAPSSSSQVKHKEAIELSAKRGASPDRVLVAVKELYTAMKGGLTGLGTDEAKIFRTLHDKSPREIQEISQVYKQHYGRNLHEDLRAELKDNVRFLKVLEVVLKGDPIQSSAAVTNLELSLPAPSLKLIEALLADKTKSELAALKKLYLDTYGEDLVSKITNTLKGHDADRLVALLNKAPGAALAAELKQILDNSILLNKEQIFTLLEGCSKPELQELMRVFYEKYGIPLARELEKHFKGLDFERALALLQPDPATACAIKIHQALEKPAKLPEVLLEILRQEPTLLQAIAQVCEKKFGASIVAELNQRDGIRAEIKKILTDWFTAGTCTESSQLFLALNAGSIGHLHLLEILQNKSSEQISRLAYGYSQEFKQDFLVHVNQVLPPERALEVRLAFSRAYSKIEEDIRNIEASYQRERRRPISFISKTLDILSPHGRILDSNFAKLHEFHAQQGPETSEDEKQNLLKLVQFVQDDLEVYKQAKQKLVRLIKRISSLIGFACTLLLLKAFALPNWEVWLYASAVGLSLHIIGEKSWRRPRARLGLFTGREGRKLSYRASRRKFAV